MLLNSELNTGQHSPMLKKRNASPGSGAKRIRSSMISGVIELNRMSKISEKFEPDQTIPNTKAIYQAQLENLYQY
jgi:hypothetical protein